MADDYYDPIRWLWNKLRGGRYGSSADGAGIDVSDEAKALDEKPGTDD